MERVQSIGRITMKGENRSSGRETYLRAIPSTTNLTRTDLGSNPCLCSKNPATDCPRRCKGTAAAA